LALFSVLALTGMLSACGGSTESKTPAPAGTGTQAARPRPHPKIGPLGSNALGQSERARIRRMLDGLFSGVNQHQASICTTIYTDRYVKAITGHTGAAGLRECKRKVGQVRYHVSLARIEGIRLRRTGTGRVTGLVQVLERIGTGRLRARISVVRTGSTYRIAAIQGEQVTA
jgi:hypothetical protein